MLKNFFYFLLPLLISGVSGIVMTPIMTYYLDPWDFGIAAILSAIMLPLSAVASSGFSIVYAGNYYALESEERKVLIFNFVFFELLLKTCGVLILWFLSPLLLPLVVHGFEPVYLLYFRLVLITFLLQALWPSLSFLIVLQKDGRTHARFEITQWLGGVGATLLTLIVFRRTTLALFVGPFVSAIVSFISCVWYLRSRATARLSRRWLKEMITVGIPSVSVNGFEVVSNTIDRYLLQRWLNLSRLGMYEFSQGFRTIFNLGMKAFNRTYAPLMLESYAKTQESEEAQRFMKGWYGVLAVGGMFTIFFSPEVIDLLTHGKFLAAAPLVPLWVFLVCFQTFGTAYVQFLFYKKSNRTIIPSRIIVGILGIVLSAVLIRFFGMIGAVLGILISNFALQVSYRICARRLGCPMRKERYFVITVALLAILYSSSLTFTLPLAVEIVVAATGTVVAGYGYGLWGLVRSYLPRLKAGLASPGIDKATP